MGKYDKKIEQIAEQLVKLTVQEALALGVCLKEQYGIEPQSQTVVVPTTSGATGATNDAVGGEEKTLFDVFLKSPGMAKIQVIKVLRDILSLPLTEAKKIVDEGDTIVKSNLSKAEAENIKKQLEEVGATVEIK